MSQDWYQDVLEFHRKFCPGQVGTAPAYPGYRTRDLRFALVGEEYEEFVAAMLEEDMPAVADALADLIYVAIGTAVACGVDLRPVFDAVHGSNMAKAGGPVRADGKRLKPPGWQPPDVAGILARQGPLDAQDARQRPPGVGVV